MGDTRVYAKAYIINVRLTWPCVEFALFFICGSSIDSSIPVPMQQIRLSTNDKTIFGDWEFKTYRHIINSLKLK